jgi:hypothetical protein
MQMGWTDMVNRFFANPGMPFEFHPPCDGTGYIIPLFWQHGEEEAVLRREIAKMHKVGISSFIVESRPHPDFLGPRWWRDIDTILDESRRRGMRVWFFDDSRFPSGYAAGRVCLANPRHRRRFLREQHIDAAGPLAGSSFQINAWLEEGDSLVCVAAARRTSGGDGLDAGSLIELSDRISDGILYWNVPDGSWRVFLVIASLRGGEDGLTDYVNPLEDAPVRAYLDTIHEEFHHRYKADFGTIIAGFFSDEPRLGNAETYLATLGKHDFFAPGTPGGALHQMSLPWSDSLPGLLAEGWQGSFKMVLPLLWHDGGDRSAQARYHYMDVVSARFSQCYTQQIGAWCRERGVKLIGHVIEDNGAHARLGYGLGHYFRAIHGQDWSGMDIVLHQVRPEFTEGTFTAMQDNMDADFFYWGLAKLASSAAHLDQRMEGVAACEIFGAYGWQEGLKLMKWLTDHVCVRGVNRLIPHAFSPKRFDPDCPPHFYAGGGNPQWRHFGVWSAYANRVCAMISGTAHIAPAAVLYHAQAEWAGAYMPFELVVKVLAQAQIDYDVVPPDVLVQPGETMAADGMLHIHRERYRCIVVPYAKRLPGALLDRLLGVAQQGVLVVFVDALPDGCSDGDLRFPAELAALKRDSCVQTCSLAYLSCVLAALGAYDIRTLARCESLRVFHAEREGKPMYFFVNESTKSVVDTTVFFRHGGVPIVYDAMAGEVFGILHDECTDGSISIRLRLEPYQSVFVIFSEDAGEFKQGTAEYREEVWLET